MYVSAVPGPPPSRRWGNLPIDLTTFVGRRREFTEAKRLLRSSRLVTLTGIGGVGKTRLALQVADDARQDFADGMWLIELAELTDGSVLGDVVANVLGVRAGVGETVEQALVEHLSTRNALLVLDNCEHLLAATAALCATVLRACRDVRILVTSREALGIGGEVVAIVAPLTVPAPDRDQTVSALAQYDAVRLFVDRAAAAVPPFALTGENGAAIAEICRRLDGLPLAIELAAARIRTLSPSQILQRLTDRYTLLTRAGRDAPTRQQTLRVCIDWSYDLCTPQEQLLWCRLSILAGSVELDAAEQICGAGFAGPAMLLDALTSLVEKSVLTREDTGDTPARFRMLETLREYGRSKTQDSGDYLDLRQRHFDWYQQLACDAEDGWMGPRQLDWIARIEREQPNFREALDFSITNDSRDGFRIAAALLQFWNARGLFSEGRYWLDRLLMRDSAEPTVELAKTLYADTVFTEAQGDRVAAALLVERSRALAAATTDPPIHAIVALTDGIAALFNGNLTGAQTLLEESLPVLAALQTPALHVSTLTMLGYTHEHQSNTARAIGCFEEVLAITEACGESVYRSYALWAMGVLLWRQGDVLRAAARLHEGLLLTIAVGHPVGSASCLEVLAWIAAGDGHLQRAAALMGAADALSHRAATLPTFLPGLLRHHHEYERTVRDALGERSYTAAYRKGLDLGAAGDIRFAFEPQSSAPKSADLDPNPLTKREREVALLVGKGLTSKAIAELLVISERTVHGHVAHILAKLNFTSRQQIASWVDQLR
jgi:predicted ATPase/DNA-binding CsgD family transcriptional regulator